MRILHDVDLDLTGRDVVLVEDLVDTGLTLGYLVKHLEAQGPRRVDVCTLLDRPARRILPVTVRYVGMEIPDVFVLGYGLHRADLYRNVPRVVDRRSRRGRDHARRLRRRRSMRADTARIDPCDGVGLAGRSGGARCYGWRPVQSGGAA